MRMRWCTAVFVAVHNLYFVLYTFATTRVSSLAPLGAFTTLAYGKSRVSDFAAIGLWCPHPRNARRSPATISLIGDD